MIKNLQKQFHKPVDTDIHEHWCRLDIRMDYTDTLPTTTVTPKITKEDRKQYFFETFSINWRQEFISIKCTDFYAAMVEDIKQFMIMQKKKTDAENNKRTNRINVIMINMMMSNPTTNLTRKTVTNMNTNTKKDPKNNLKKDTKENPTKNNLINSIMNTNTKKEPKKEPKKNQIKKNLINTNMNTKKNWIQKNLIKNHKKILSKNNNSNTNSTIEAASGHPRLTEANHAQFIQVQTILGVNVVEIILV